MLDKTITLLIMLNVVIWCVFGLLKGLAWIATFLMGVA